MVTVGHALRADDLRAVLAPFGDARPLPRDAYVDPRALELETRTIFESTWIPVAHEADLEGPGAWVRAPIRGEHLVIVRGADLELRALHAVCSHRGTLLCEGERGRFDRLEIECPYHGFTYRTDGTLQRAPGAPKLPPASELGLQCARVASFAGVVFVCLDPLAPNLFGGDPSRGAEGQEADAHALPPWLGRAKLSTLARARRTDHEVVANWKLIVANFQESHHFRLVHPSLEAKTPWGQSKSIIESQQWLGGEMQLRAGAETVSETGMLSGRPFVAAEEDRRRVLDALVLPLWLTSLQPDYLLTYRLAPLAIDRTLVVAEIHVHASVVQRRESTGDLFSFWDRTNAEDRQICERQQRGLSSTRARPSVYATSEDGLHAFERWVAARYLRAMGAGETA